jgi:membrane-associated protease RseP (regulator of RpoE activity)
MIKEYIANHKKYSSFYETYVGTFFGVPLVIKNLLFVALAVAYYYNMLYLGLAGVISIIIHEYSHVFAAKRFGVKAEKVSIGLLVGYAEIGEEIEQDPKKEFLIAFAGPLSNILLSVLSFSALFLFVAFGLEPVITTYSLAINVTALYSIESLFWFGVLNVFNGLVNLIPAVPLDGGRMLRAVLSKFYDFDKATHISLVVSVIVSVIAITLGIIYNYHLISYVFAGIGLVALYLRRAYKM